MFQYQCNPYISHSELVVENDTTIPWVTLYLYRRDSRQVIKRVELRSGERKTIRNIGPGVYEIEVQYQWGGGFCPVVNMSRTFRLSECLGPDPENWYQIIQG